MCMTSLTPNRIISEYRSLPSVSQLLDSGTLGEAPRDVLVPAIRKVLDGARAGIAAGGTTSEAELIREIHREVRSSVERWPRKVINATGVVLHTNLGRAVLSEDALHAMREAAAYSDLEMDLASGERGHRDTHVASLLTALTGAEAATVVNNCAGALVLGLSALAWGREVVVSRGQSVEIGGKFRIPDVCEQSGATLREVGTTNRTYASDYEQACTERTGLLLRVHRSNFHLVGFTSDVDISDMAAIGRERGIPVLNDLGSGCMVDTSRWGLRHEPTVRESVRDGADVTMFSGDKLLGGPQAGMIVGRQDMIARIRRHPLARALRCDKATLAALHATLLHYLLGEAEEKIPTLRMLARTRSDIAAQAGRWRDALGVQGAEVLDTVSAVGGGTLPGSELPSAALALDPSVCGLPAGELARRLRTASQPVVARVERDRVWLDPRTVQPDEDIAIVRTIQVVITRSESE